jgi:hypothetical protein
MTDGFEYLCGISSLLLFFLKVGSSLPDLTGGSDICQGPKKTCVCLSSSLEMCCQEQQTPVSSIQEWKRLFLLNIDTYAIGSKRKKIMISGQDCNENSNYLFPEKELRFQSQFPHSCVCERFLYSQNQSTYPNYSQTHE